MLTLWNARPDRGAPVARQRGAGKMRWRDLDTAPDSHKCEQVRSTASRGGSCARSSPSSPYSPSSAEPSWRLHPPAPPTAAPDRGDQLEVYVVELPASQVEKLEEVGIDAHHATTEQAGKGLVDVEAVITEIQAQKLRSAGMSVTLKRIDGERASAGGGRAECRRPRRLPVLQRARRDRRRAPRRGGRPPPDRQAREDREDRSRGRPSWRSRSPRRPGPSGTANARRSCTPGRSTRASGSLPR